MKKKYFKAAVLFNKKKIHIINLEYPKILDYGQVLVKLNYAGICGSQIGEYNFVKGKDSYVPHLFGHEGSGIVENIGPGVKKVKVGDKIIVHWKPGSGIDAEPYTYTYKKKKINSGKATTFSEFSVVSENRVTKINSKINMIDACLVGCSISTSFGMLNNDLKLKIGENILILGAGAIGLTSIIGAKLVGAGSITVLDISQKKLKLAKKIGADYCINSKGKNLKKIFSQNIHKNYSSIIDTTGNTKLISYAYELVSKSGKILLVGVPNYKKKINIKSLPLHFNTKIFGTHGGNVNPDIDFPRYERVIAQNKLNIGKKIVQNIIKLDDIEKVFIIQSKNRNKGKYIIKF